MSDLTVAFATSSYPWFSRWWRYLSDHTAIRVVEPVVEARAAFDRDWDVLVIDGSHSLYRRSLVQDAHSIGRRVIAVWDTHDARSKARALAADPDALIESDATPEELVRELGDLEVVRSRVASRTVRTRPGPAVRRAGRIVAVGGPSMTTWAIGIGLAGAFGDRRESTILVDANDVFPAAAPALGLQPVPNLATAVQALRADPDDRLTSVVQAPPDVPFYVLAGLSAPSQWSEVPARSVREVLARLAQFVDHVVVLVGPAIDDLSRHGTDRFGPSRGALAEADAVVAVGEAGLVGSNHFEHWLDGARHVFKRSVELHLVAARAPADGFRRSEVVSYLESLPYAAASITLLASDEVRIDNATWQGKEPRRGPLLRGVGRLADQITPTTKGRRR